MVRVVIDRGSCMGAGECVHRLPGVFAFDEGHRGMVLPVDLAAQDLEALIDASACCPNFAITVEDDVT